MTKVCSKVYADGVCGAKKEDEFFAENVVLVYSGISGICFFVDFFVKQYHLRTRQRRKTLEARLLARGNRFFVGVGVVEPSFHSAGNDRSAEFFGDFGSFW